MSEPRTSESESSGLGWPTPTAMDSRSAARAHYDWGRPGVTLTDAMRAWPTPTAARFNDGEEPEAWRARQAVLAAKNKGVNGNGAGVPLSIAAKEWPTPVASESANRTTKEPPQSIRNGHGRHLSAMAISGWPTPRATDGDKGGPNGRDGSGSPHLPMAATGWSTPTAQDGTSGPGVSPQREGGMNLRTQATQHSLPDPTTPTGGDATSSGTRVLNPRFVEALMGFPIGWTGFERLATRWSPPRPSVPSSFWPSDSEA